MSLLTYRLFGAFLFTASLAHSAPPTPDYELLFADEFSGERVNERDWNFRTGPRTGTGIDDLNLACNVRGTDGHLMVDLKRETVDSRALRASPPTATATRFGFSPKGPPTYSPANKNSTSSAAIAVLARP